jgi:hypothetical protein
MDRDGQGGDCGRPLGRKEDVRAECGIRSVKRTIDRYCLLKEELERDAELVQTESARLHLPFELIGIWLMLS